LAIKLFDNLINQVQEIIDCEFGVMDESGQIIASSNRKRIGEVDALAQEVLLSEKDNILLEGTVYQKIYIKNRLEYIAYMISDDPNARKYLSLISMNLVNMKTFYDDKYDKSNFIKSIIMDNILPGEIPIRAKELHLENDVYRVVFLIRVQKPSDTYVYDVVQSLFPNRNKDFVIAIDETNIALVKEVKSKKDNNDTEKISKNIIDTLSSELMVKASVGIGTIVDNIRDIGRSYKEAQLALQIGAIFEADKSIINYNSLGIGRLVYQLPTTLCKLFLNEVFKDGSFDDFDSETLLTIQKFYENDLNVSETSRELYVHRNTLVYRLDKIEKLTGLDLRKFDDAIVLKVAMMVKKYLDSCENGAK